MTLSPNRDPLLDQIANSLKQRGLHAVALTMLEAGRPLTFVGSQLLWLAQPALALLWPSIPVSRYARLMENPATVSALMDRLATDEARS